MPATSDAGKSLRSISPNHTHTVNGRHLVIADCLKPQRNLLLVLEHLSRDLVFDIEELAGGAAVGYSLNRLLTDALAVSENLKIIRTVFFGEVSSHHCDWMRWLDCQIIRKPFSPATSGAALRPINCRLLTLLIEILLFLRVARLDEADGCRLEFALTLPFQSNLRQFPLPAFRIVNVEIDFICALMQTIEGNQTYRLRLILNVTSGSASVTRLAGYGLQPVCYGLIGDE